MEVNILPISKHFDLRDLKRFDRDSYICNLEEIGKCNSTSPIFKSFFYRTTLLWNQLPQNIRTMPSVINVFKTLYIRGLV